MQNYGGDAAVVYIKDRNYTGGTVTDLEPARVPIETREANSKKWLEPMVTSTGYLRVLEEGTDWAVNEPTEVMRPTDQMQRLVELWQDTQHTGYDVLRWRGFLKPESYNQDWGERPAEVELPMVSCLEALGGVDMDAADGLGHVTIAALIKEALDATGVDWERVYLPKEVYDLAKAGEWAVPLVLEVSRYNYFKANNGGNIDDPDYKALEGMSYRELLEEIARMWGWCAREHGKDLWFETRRVYDGTVTYCYVTYAQLAVLADIDTWADTFDPGILETQTVTISVDDWEADDNTPWASQSHTHSVDMGAKTVVVKADVNAMNDMLPDVGNMDKQYQSTITLNTGQDTVQRNILYKVVDTDHCEAYCYNLVRCSEDEYGTYRLEQTAWAPELIVEGNAGIGAVWCKFDRYDTTDTDKLNYDYKEGFVVRTSVNYVILSGQSDAENLQIESRYLPLIRLTGSKAFFANSGCFVLNPTYVEYAPHFTSMYLTLRVGNKYWNGTEWTASATQSVTENGRTTTVATHFILPMEATGDETVETTNQKTLSMPYNGATGYIIPITEALYGDVELTVLTRQLHDTQSVQLRTIKELTLEYINEDASDLVENEESVEYYAVTGIAADDRQEVEVMQATKTARTKNGYALMTYGGEYLEEDWLQIGHVQDCYTECPEKALLRLMRSIYSNYCKRERYELHLDLDDSLLDGGRLTQVNGQYQRVESVTVDWAAAEMKVQLGSVIDYLIQ